MEAGTCLLSSEHICHGLLATFAGSLKTIVELLALPPKNEQQTCKYLFVNEDPELLYEDERDYSNYYNVRIDGSWSNDIQTGGYPEVAILKDFDEAKRYSIVFNVFARESDDILLH